MHVTMSEIGLRNRSI